MINVFRLMVLLSGLAAVRAQSDTGPGIELPVRIYFSTDAVSAYVVTGASITIDAIEPFGFKISSDWPIAPEDSPLITQNPDSDVWNMGPSEKHSHRVHLNKSVDGYLLFSQSDEGLLGTSVNGRTSTEELASIHKLKEVGFCRGYAHVYLQAICAGASYPKKEKKRNVCPLDIPIWSMNPGCVSIDTTLIRRAEGINLPKADMHDEFTDIRLVASPEEKRLLLMAKPHYSCIGIYSMDEPIGAIEEKDVFISYNDQVGASELGPLCLKRHVDQKQDEDYRKRRDAILKHPNVILVTYSEID
jgi:hypothetical protein